MASDQTGMCDECGKPASVHLAEICDGTKTLRSLCVEHAPAEMRDLMPFGPHRTPAEEVEYLQKQMTIINQQITDPAQRAEMKAELDQLIADIEAGRKRLGET